jgi:hypothetical protein
MLASKFQYIAALPTLISKLISVIRSKAPDQLLLSAHNKVHILTPPASEVNGISVSGSQSC